MFGNLKEGEKMDYNTYKKFRVIEAIETVQEFIYELEDEKIVKSWEQGELINKLNNLKENI